jgi:histidinol phosphatase-like enzyme
VLYRHHREFEPPEASEGFASVATEPFVRLADPRHTARAVILACDGLLLRSRSGGRAPITPDDVEVDPRHAAVLRRYADDGWTLLGIAWRPEIEDGTADRAGVDAAFVRMREALGVNIDVACCPHAAGPMRCWCRKPLPGLGAWLVERHRLDPSRCLYVGSGTADKTFARRLAFTYRDAEDFFA